MDICTEAGRWWLGGCVAIGLIVLVIALWTLSIFLEAKRRIIADLRAIEPPPPPTWRSEREIVARGRERVGEGDPPLGALAHVTRDLDGCPETPRSGSGAAPRP